MLELNADHQPDLERLSDIFVRFAEIGCKGSSPIYERLSLNIAQDDHLLALAAHTAPSQPVPNLVFASVQDLLLQNAEGFERLAPHYPTLANGATPTGDLVKEFKRFSLENAQNIVQRLSTRTVQTNQVGRCAITWPVFSEIFEQGGQRPLSLIEIGTSAGLNLIGDRYRYSYTPSGEWGDPQSNVALHCEIRGPKQPPLPKSPPAVQRRIGLDLHPIDVHNEDSVRWLRALIWPEHTGRLSLLNDAIRVAQHHDLTLVQGDALETLPGVLADIPAEDAVCVFHSFTLNQWPQAARAQLRDLLAIAATSRPLHYLSLEWIGTDTPELALTRWFNGKPRVQKLARCEGHGRWVEWLAPQSFLD